MDTGLTIPDKDDTEVATIPNIEVNEMDTDALTTDIEVNCSDGGKQKSVTTKLEVTQATKAEKTTYTNEGLETNAGDNQPIVEDLCPTSATEASNPVLKTSEIAKPNSSLIANTEARLDNEVAGIFSSGNSHQNKEKKS